MACVCGRGTITLKALRRALIFSTFSRCTYSFSSPTCVSLNISKSNTIHRHFSSTKKPVDTKVNFSLSDSDDENSNTTYKEKVAPLPPPYDPFRKKPTIQEPSDPNDLQQIFHNMRSGDGLFNHAVKMFDALSKEGLTHEALHLFSHIKDRGHMPDVVAHTAVLEAYANAGQPKDALKVYMRMLSSGVLPNAYTYAVLIKGLATDPKFINEATKYVLEMMDKGMRPNAQTYTCVFEGLLKEDRLQEAARLLHQMKAKGFVPDQKALKEVIGTKRGPLYTNLINLLFAK